MELTVICGTAADIQTEFLQKEIITALLDGTAAAGTEIAAATGDAAAGTMESQNKTSTAEQAGAAQHGMEISAAIGHVILRTLMLLLVMTTTATDGTALHGMQIKKSARTGIAFHGLLLEALTRICTALAHSTALTGSQQIQLLR